MLGEANNQGRGRDAGCGAATRASAGSDVWGLDRPAVELWEAPVGELGAPRRYVWSGAGLGPRG